MFSTVVVVVAQSVRAPDCGSGGCGFDSRQPPSEVPDHRRKPAELVQRSVAQVVEHRSPKPGVAGSSPAGPVESVASREAASRRWRWRSSPKQARNCSERAVDWRLRTHDSLTTALSSRGLGRGPLKAQTRVRIPLALFCRWERPHRLSVRTGPFQGPERGSTPLGAMQYARR